MSEKPTNTKDQRPKTCPIAIWSFVLAVVSFFIFIGVTALVAIPTLPKHLEYLYNFIPFSVCVFVGSYLASLILGIGGILQIRETKLKGIRLAIGAEIANVIVFVGIITVIQLIVRPIYYRMYCGTNLEGLGKALQLYANDFDGKYPTADKWCDLLIQHEELTENAFQCPAVKTGLSHYAINPDCEPNSPLDVVLVFETKEGWNQHGGPEILVGDRHWRQGSCVLFNDTHVKFIEKKNLTQLKWKPEDSNSVGKSISK